MKCRAQESSAQSLLEFMDVASDAVKCALKKPTTFKRNINHRRYLQKQVKTVVRSRRNPRKINPCDLKEDVQDLVREAIKELKYSQCYTNALETLGHRGATPSSQHMRSASPPQQIHNDFQSPRKPNPTYRLTHLPFSRPTPHQIYTHPPLDNANHRFETCSALYPKFNPSSEDAGFSLNPNAEDEYFMSGEELTNNIDINDLYIPELHEARSPVVKCEDYIVENELEIPSPMYDERSGLHFQFEPNLGNLEQFL